MPALIHDLLLSDGFSVFARLLLTSFFWIAGFFGVFKFGVMVQAIARENLPWPRFIVVLMILTELIGSALLVSDFRGMGWLGAGALGVFTLLSIPLGHAFWKLQPPKKIEEFQIALEHLGIIGGLMCAAVLTVA
ncbi:DoxX family protein [Pseudomonas petrae]|uniref:DoxX family protein n=1 Tax=Pseudomonas petrae TaxID=2912190 RepID=A0ABS9I862_9PSED|nr:DoxX family protein [Pseudomonas petrae]MCF7543950.1 DoxX family protein [Pseudomonas petrae]